MEERRERAARRERRAGRLLVVLGAVGVGLVGAWLGMLLLARTTVSMGPFRVEVSAAFGRGVTRLGLPPFGELAADTHVAPIRLSTTLRDVGVQRLTDLVAQRGVDGLVDDVERDAPLRLRAFAWRLLASAGAGALALSILVYRTRWREIAIGTATAIVVVAASEGLALATFRAEAFAEPTYSGSLALAPKLIGPVREATGRIEDFRAGLEQLIDGTVRAYTTIQTTPLIDEDTIRVLHISDIHASPLGMDFAREVARGFDVDLVIDTGDLTSFATPVEDLIVARIPGFLRPYVFVRGNHDSMTLQAQVAGQPNAVVLDGRAETIEGLTVYGLGHPAFTPARGVEVDDEAFAELARSAGERIAADLEELDLPVDLIAVHDDRMAEAVAGRVPVVISGHFHETRAEVVDGTLFLQIATTGGSGAGVFRGLDEIPLSAQVLYFTREPRPELVAFDVIEQLPETGDLTVRRTTVAEAFPELALSPSPSPTAPAATSSP